MIATLLSGPVLNTAVRTIALSAGRDGAAAAVPSADVVAAGPVAVARFTDALLSVHAPLQLEFHFKDLDVCLPRWGKARDLKELLRRRDTYEDGGAASPRRRRRAQALLPWWQRGGAGNVNIHKAVPG